MRNWKYLFLILAVFSAVVLRARGGETPATQPTGAAVRGHVKIASGIGWSKADLSRTVLFIASDAALDVLPKPTTRASVSQRNKTFTPNFLIVQRGMEVEFPNWDDFDHNVFSRSAAAPAFDLDRYPRGQSKTRTFEKLGVVQIFCNIHPQMRAVIFVTPNQFHARGDAEGRFEIASLPPGKYELVAWHERCEEQRQPIEVRAGEPVEIDFTLKESRERALSSSESNRKKYGGVERGLGVKREKLNLPVVTESHPAPPESKP